FTYSTPRMATELRPPMVPRELDCMETPADSEVLSWRYITVTKLTVNCSQDSARTEALPSIVTWSPICYFDLAIATFRAGAHKSPGVKLARRSRRSSLCGSEPACLMRSLLY